MSAGDALDDIQSHRSDALEFDLDLVAVLYGTDTRRRTRGDDVARIKRHHRRRHFDHAGNVENEIARIGVLFEFAVDPKPSLQMRRRVADFVFRHNPRPDRTESIKTFARDAFLFAADHRIDETGIAEHIVAIFGAGNVAALARDDDRELALMINATPNIDRQHNGIGWTAQRGRRFEEETLIVGAV